MNIKKISLLKVLSDRNRLRVLNLLSKRDVCICELSDILEISQPAVSKHIKKLVLAGLIKSKKKSFWTYCSLNNGNSELNKMVNSILKFVKCDIDFKGDIKKLKSTTCKLREKK